MSRVCGFIVFIAMICGVISIIWWLIAAVTKKNIRIPFRVGITCVAVVVVFTIIGTISWTKTDDYQEYLAEKATEDAEKEEQLERETENEGFKTELKEKEPEIEESDKEENNIANKNKASETNETTVKTKDESQFQLAVEAIGMNYSNVKNIQNLDDWASGKRYSFVYDGFGYIVYELDNGEIDSINTEYKRAKIYERGYKPLNYKDFEPDKNVLEALQKDMFERLSQYIIGEDSVKSKMGSMMYSRIYDYYSISGEVKAKNAASKKDFTFTVDYIVTGDSYECTYVAIDGNIVYGSDQTPDIAKEELVQDDSTVSENIILSDGKEGEYGQYDLFDGEPYLRYYVPVGNYTVKCNIRGGLYIETIEIHKEDGFDASTTIQQITMSAGDEQDIVIEEGQCISLYMNTEIELIKK